MLGPTLSETNLIQTLHQHGLALSDEDLHTLRNFIKPSEVSEQSNSALGGSDSIANGLKGPMLKAPAAAVSLTLGNGQVIQLTEPFPDAQQPRPVQFVTNPFEPTQVFQAAAAPEVVQTTTSTTNHGFQNEFLEDLARSQIVSDPKKVKNKTTPVRPANTNNNAPKKKPEPRKKKPTPVKAGTNATTPQTVVVPSQTGGGANANVPRVQTIKLSPENQQVFTIYDEFYYLN